MSQSIQTQAPVTKSEIGGWAFLTLPTPAMSRWLLPSFMLHSLPSISYRKNPDLEHLTGRLQLPSAQSLR